MIKKFINDSIHMIWREYSLLPEGQNMRILFHQPYPIVMQWGVTHNEKRESNDWILPRNKVQTIQEFVSWINQ